MDDMKFAEIMQRERERLGREREEILKQQQDLENEINEINRELAAVDAYQAVKTGKAATRTRQPRAAGRSGASITHSLPCPALSQSQEPGGTPWYKLSGSNRTVSAAAKSLSGWVSKGINLPRSRCRMPSRR